VLALIAYLLTAVAVGIFSYRGFELYKKISAGQSDPSRFNNKGLRLKNMLVGFGFVGIGFSLATRWY